MTPAERDAYLARQVLADSRLGLFDGVMVWLAGATTGVLGTLAVVNLGWLG